jgi:predicted transcriptional regulator
MTPHQITTTILSRMADLSQHQVATTAGLSDATISKWKVHDLEPTASILSALGLKLVDANLNIVDDEYMRSLVTLARMALDRKSESGR